MDLTIDKNIRDNTVLRESFMELAVKIFDLSFKAWYQAGYWTENYTPYALIDGEKVAANISINRIDTVLNGKPRQYIQLGTVMTDPAYRSKGLCRRLMQEVLQDWQGKCDGIYLYANETVLDFYPKFGFVNATEYQYSMPLTPKPGKIKKLDMADGAAQALLKKYYLKSNSFSALPMLHNFGLLMFYCSDFMKDCVFYCEDYDAVIIAMQNKETFICYDIFCETDEPMAGILSAAAGMETANVLFGFTPKDTAGCTVHPIESAGDTLFVLESKDNIFTQGQMMFPVLSHA